MPSLSPARQRALFETRGAARRRGRAPRVRCHTFGGCGGPPCLSARRDRAGTAPLPPAYGTRGELFGLGPRAKGCRLQGESACSPSSFFSWILEPFLFSLLGCGKERGRGPSSVRRYLQLRSAPQPPSARVASFGLFMFAVLYFRDDAYFAPVGPTSCPRPLSQPHVPSLCPLQPLLSPWGQLTRPGVAPARRSLSPPLAPNATQQPPQPPLAPLPARWVLYERIQTSLFLFINIVLLDSCFVVVFFLPRTPSRVLSTTSPQRDGAPWVPHFMVAPPFL